MRKLFCYVDETGQDTVAQHGKKPPLFVVGMVLVDADQRRLENTCVQYEKASGKGAVPWHKAKHAYRLNFMRRVLADQRFGETLYYQVFRQPTRLFFDTYTLQGIAGALRCVPAGTTTVKAIYVDGLTRSKQSEYGVELRRLGIRRASFHRATDQSSPFIRLADALVGLVREAIEDSESEAGQLLKHGARRGVITRAENEKPPREVVF